MKIGVIAEKRYLAQHMPLAVIDVLRRRNHHVDVISPDSGFCNVEDGVFTDSAGESFGLKDYDLIVSRNRNALGLVLLRYAEEARIPSINNHCAVQKVRNKAKMAATLALAGVKAATTLLAGSSVALASHLTDDDFPLMLKAVYGDNCQGLQLVHNREELAEIRWPSEVVLAQRYFANDRYDLKLYVCGERVHAVRKPSPFNGDMAAPSIPVKVSRELEKLARSCGEAFGLELFGVDCIETVSGPVVIEVNDFPNYTGIPGIADTLADHIVSRAAA
jgi:ribosomal protein S6--L-glutamate ligase